MASVSKLDYLKRYMDKPTESSKKKRKKVKKSNNIKIIDDSISLSALSSEPSNNNKLVEDEGEF